MDIQIGTEQFEAVAAKIRQSQQNLLALENLMRQDRAVAAKIGRDVVAMRTEHNRWADRFTTLYSAVFGRVPAGLQGPILVAAGVVAGLAAIGGAIAILIMREQRKMEEARATEMVQTTAQSLLQQAAQLDIEAKAEEARGNITAAREKAAQAAALRAQAGVTAAPPGTRPTDFSAWFQTNWPWLALATGLIFVAPRLVEGAMARGRR